MMLDLKILELSGSRGLGSLYIVSNKKLGLKVEIGCSLTDTKCAISEFTINAKCKEVHWIQTITLY